MTDFVQISTTANASAGEIWAALTKPEIIKTYFFGAIVDTDWQPGSPVTWSGEYKGKKFQDKGRIKEFDVNKRLSMTHWSPMSGLADVPENYHAVAYDIEPNGDNTKITLTQ